MNCEPFLTVKGEQSTLAAARLSALADHHPQVRRRADGAEPDIGGEIRKAAFSRVGLSAIRAPLNSERHARMSTRRTPPAVQYDYGKFIRISTRRLTGS